MQCANVSLYVTCDRVHKLYVFLQRWAPDVYDRELAADDVEGDMDERAAGDGARQAAEVIGEHLQSGKKLVKQMTKDLEVSI